MSMTDFGPDDVDPEEFAAIAAQLPVVSAAWNFINCVYMDQRIDAAWPFIDPTLRLCWVQSWIDANGQAISEDGYDRETVAAALKVTRPRHPLWRNFQRVWLRDLRGLIDFDPETYGIGSNARVLAVDTELLYLQDKSGLIDSRWEAGTERTVFPIVMRYASGQWRVLNFGSDTVPEPGWPPHLGA